MPHPDLNELRRVARGGSPSRTPTPRATPSRPTPSPSRSSGTSNSNSWVGPLLGWGVGIWIVISGINCLNSAVRNNSRQTYAASTQQQPAVQVSMPSPARDWIPTKVMGIWSGTFSDDIATLHIRTRKDNRFTGLLTVRATKGTYRIAVSGVLADSGRIGWEETKVIRVPRGSKWTRGINVGTFSSGNQAISGQGKDRANSTYSWSFRRAS
jgi:hypothetical protein